MIKQKMIYNHDSFKSRQGYVFEDNLSQRPTFFKNLNAKEDYFNQNYEMNIPESNLTAFNLKGNLFSNLTY